MSLIVCDRVSITFGAVTVLSSLDLRVEARDRIGIVGVNGAGKSSLLDVIAGVAPPAAGTVERERRLRVAYLPQDAPEPVAATVLAEAMASREDLAGLREQLARLEGEMGAAPVDLTAVMERYGEAQQTYEALGGYELESRARAVLGGLGLDEELQRRSPRELSGGQVRRLELAKLLLQDADLLLIDEPTNHLDLAAIEWMEELLPSLPVALVLVSHDRRFLDRVCGRILELSHGIPEEYPGNYAAYVRLRAERRERRRKEYEQQQAYVTHQEDFIRRYKAGQRAKEARGRQTKLDRLVRVPPPREEDRPRLRFSTAPAANVLLRATDLVAGRGGTPLVELARAVIGPGDRIAVVGPNGGGKSTLLHTLAAELAPVAGTVAPGARMRRRLYRQDLGGMDDRRTVLEELLAEHPLGEERGRTVLGSLLFEGDDVFKRVGDLSGGERARLALGRLSLEQTNLLLLDEPTNHLDVLAQEVLEEAIRHFPGGVVLVSHDRALIDAVATRVWSVEASPPGSSAAMQVREVLGGYTDLLRSRRPQAGRAVTMEPLMGGARARSGASTRAGPAQAPAGMSAPAPGSGAAAAGGHQRDGGRPAEARAERADDRARVRSHGASVRRIEGDIAAVEEKLVAARERLLDPATFSDPAVGAEAGRDYDRLAAALAELYERWAEVVG